MVGMCTWKALRVVLLLVFLEQSWARSWRDLELIQDLEPKDIAAVVYLNTQDLLQRSVLSESSTQLARERASTEKSLPTTNAPSPSPLLVQSAKPSFRPSGSPTRPPTASPMSSPSIAPTSDPYKENEPPANPDKWYFNYDLSAASRFGPGKLGLIRENGAFTVDIENDQWGQVARPPDDYWTEFTDNGFGPWKGTLQNHDPTKNICQTGNQQSPIDVRENGAVCYEHHQVRTLPGDFQVTGEHVAKRILSNKLQLVFQRRPCLNLSKTECQQPNPPHADFPHGWGGFADSTHIDFKVPSEHTIWNERFDAEMQVFHIHPGRRRLAALSVLIRATADGYNYYLQAALDAFQHEYNKNAAYCGRQLREEGRTVSEVPRVLGGNLTSPFVDYLSWAKALAADNKQPFEGGPWNPYHVMMIPTIYFYRYEGSLTEPPCGEFVSWWIADQPMIMSFDQLDQLKMILFTNVDANCKKTSVQSGLSVARPIRKTNNRPVWKCTATNFGPDTGT
jgi:carbonic anhydrase